MDDIKAEYIFNEQVHVKEEEDDIKEEPEWEVGAGLRGVSAAAARAGLYANHEVKEELVLGPAGVQPADVAFTLHAAQAVADKKQHKVRDCVVQLERVDAPAPRSVQQLHVSGTELDDNVHVKEEEDDIKEEPEWEVGAGLRGVSAAAARAGLYANHKVKEELVLGPEGVQPADIAFTLYACQASAARAQPALRDCVVRLKRPGRDERLATRAGRGTDMEKEIRGNGDVSTEEETYICDTCKKQFPLKSQLVEHVMGHNQRPESRRAGNARGGRGEGREPTRAKGSRHACPTCYKDFPTPSHLKIHERTHTGERPFACGICQQKFTQLNNLKSHERTHTGDKPFSCVICKQKFTRLYHLKRHEPTHTGKMPFSCEICKQKFTQLSHLKGHERIHTGERPFSCGICKNKFTQLGHLKSHERIHTSEKPFSCGICHKKFSRLGNLKVHERIHTGEKPFSCGICKQKFARLSLVKRHERTHTAEIPFACDVCKKQFTELKSFKNHKDRIHAD